MTTPVSTSPIPQTPSFALTWRGWLFGAIAMLAMLGVITLARQVSDAVSLLDALADAFLLVLPLSMFSWFMELFGAQAKTLLLIGLVAALVLLGAWLGGRLIREGERQFRIVWPRAAMLASVLFGLGAAFVLLYTNAQSPELLSDGGFLATTIALALGATAFAVVLGGLVRSALSAERDVERPDRRAALAWGAAAMVAVAGAIVVGRDFLRVASRKADPSRPSGEMVPAITPVEDFYVVSKNFLDPDNDRGPDWSIAVDGLVDTELTLGQADLEALGRETYISTQLCISNPIGGDLIGTAEWTGVPLAAVLEQAGVQDGAFKVIFEGTDGYTTGVPVDRVMAPESHIVWAMNDVPLPREHGAPVRAVIPGLYGMKSVKWLTKMTVTADDYQGYWEQRDWTDEALVKPMSRIDVPASHDIVPVGPVQVGGVAFGGDRGVSGVEVSFDDGATWQAAEIREDPNPEGIAWVTWALTWEATAGGYTLAVRMIDDAGEVQTDEHASVLPDGASGWHRVTVGVA